MCARSFSAQWLTDLIQSRTLQCFCERVRAYYLPQPSEPPVAVTGVGIMLDFTSPHECSPVFTFARLCGHAIKSTPSSLCLVF